MKTIAPSFPDHLGWSPDFAAILKERIIPNPHGGYLLTSQMLPGLADLSALLHHLERATFIGEETAGGYYGNSSGKIPAVTLPLTGLKLQLPLYGYWNAVLGDPGERRGTRPDVTMDNY